MAITTALQFSGGKDSLAILHMYRDQLDGIVVVWVNTGAAYPEVQKEMARLAKKIPHFLVVKGNQQENIRRNGYPSDIVPIRYSPVGRYFIKSAETFKMQSAFDCCSSNMWEPLAKTMRLMGIKTVIRGQRRDEQYKNPLVFDGAVVDGIKYVLPLETWTAEQVFQYLRDNEVKLPDYYSDEVTSHDCWSCTAYLDAYQTRIQKLPPAARAEVKRRLVEIQQAIDATSAPLKRLLAE
jgi:3'-phosphoadenosine 5'-phosphosulfate sulfotransferase (PAPS reductase)/FAD synthetase